MAEAFVFGIRNFDRMKNDVYNTGSEDLNYSKEEIALKIQNKIPFYLHFADVGKDEDQRNYEVSYEKICGLGWKTKVDVDAGIEELIRVYSVVDVHSEFSNV